MQLRFLQNEHNNQCLQGKKKNLFWHCDTHDFDDSINILSGFSENLSKVTAISNVATFVTNVTLDIVKFQPGGSGGCINHHSVM